MSARFPRRQTQRVLRALPRAFVFALLTVALLVPAALGGTHFTWCIALARAQLHCCCDAIRAHNPGAHEHHAGAALEATCCEGRHLARATAASDPATFAHPAVLPAALVAFLTLEALFPAQHALARARIGARSAQPRAGPEPPLYALNRAYLC